MGGYFSTPAPLQSPGDLLDLFGVHVRSVEGRRRFEVGNLAALGWAILHLTVAAVNGREAVPDLPDLPVVIGAEAIQDTVEALVDVLPGVRELVAIYLWHGQQLGYVDAREVGERLGVGLLMDASANDQVPDHLARHGVLGALVDP